MSPAADPDRGPGPHSADAPDLETLAAAGDPDAWEGLLRRYYPRLVAYARLRMPNTEAAARAANSAFDGLHDTIRRTRPPVAVRLFRCLRETLAECGAPAPAAQAVRLTTTDFQLLPPDPTDPATAYLDAFARLGRDERDVLALRAAGGLDEQEVASVVKRRRGHARALQARALAELKSSVAGDLHGTDVRAEVADPDVDVDVELGAAAARGGDDAGSELELLTGLARALAATEEAGLEPPAATVVAVRQRAIAARSGTDPKVEPARTHLRHYSLLSLAVGGIIVTALFMGLVVGSARPAPVRAFARLLGLPVESAAMARTQAEISTLASALERGDMARAATADHHLDALLEALDGDERAAVAPVAAQLRRRLTELVAAGPASGQTDPVASRRTNASSSSTGTPSSSALSSLARPGSAPTTT